MSDIFYNVDVLENLPAVNRKNWEFETEFLVKTIKPGSKILQIGCTLGDRLVVLHNSIKSLDLWGIDIDKNLIKQCTERLNKLKIKARLFMADAQNLPDFGTDFDYVICLNNTLGYIPDDTKAIEEMRCIADTLIVSVYSDTKFTDKVARDYFNSIGTKVRKTWDDVIYIKGARMRRYSMERIESLFDNKVNFVESPLGFICVL